MLDFFIALFGGIYYAGKYINEKTSIEAANARSDALCKARQTDYDRFIAKMTNRELERKVEQDVYRGKYKELIEKVSMDVLAKGFARGLNLEDRHCRPFQMVNVYPNYRLLIAMASIGKLPYSVAAFGIRRPVDGDLWDIHAIFMEWIDKELQSHGVEPMVFQGEGLPSMAVNGVKVYAKDAQRRHGCYGWYSMRLFL